MIRKIKKTKGQMRVVEAILASFVIVFALAFVYLFATVPSSSMYEVGELERVGQNVLHSLDDKGLLSRFVSNEEWENLTTALRVSLPTDAYFNLTVYDMDGKVINDELIHYGDLEIFVTSTSVASVTYIIPGYQTTYDPRILVLLVVSE